MEAGTDVGDGGGCWKRDGDGANKDIAESPTAEPERPNRNPETKNHRTSKYSEDLSFLY